MEMTINKDQLACFVKEYKRVMDERTAELINKNITMLQLTNVLKMYGFDESPNMIQEGLENKKEYTCINETSNCIVIKGELIKDCKNISEGWNDVILYINSIEERVF